MKKRNRRGYTLAFFVLFLVMCFALAALLIDIGLVHLTRRQLQTAANTAAKEALYDVDGDGRVNAQRFVQAVFDDDFDPTTADALSLGAGPDVPYYDGEQISGDFRASAKYYLPDDPFSPVPSGRSAVGVYKPDVALNAGNEADGDIVRGRYIEIEEDLSKDHTESSYNTSDPYRRDDFEPDPLGNSVLVRMRRTGEPSDGAVRTSGPPVPFMFGRGLLSAGSQEFWSKIERGTHVRATAIANATPARTCGVAHPGLIGLINVQMSVATWEDGTPAVIGNGPNEIQIFDNLEVTAIGRRPFDNGSGPPTLIGDGTRQNYVVLTDDIAVSSETSVRLVVGFGSVDNVTIDSSTTPATASFQRPLTQPIARENASATLSFRNQTADGLTNANASLVFGRNLALADQILRVPALVRSTE